jgi:hypothetical protein
MRASEIRNGSISDIGIVDSGPQDHYVDHIHNSGV